MWESYRPLRIDIGNFQSMFYGILGRLADNWSLGQFCTGIWVSRVLDDVKDFLPADRFAFDGGIQSLETNDPFEAVLES